MIPFFLQVTRAAMQLEYTCKITVKFILKSIKINFHDGEKGEINSIREEVSEASAESR